MYDVSPWAGSLLFLPQQPHTLLGGPTPFQLFLEGLSYVSWKSLVEVREEMGSVDVTLLISNLVAFPGLENEISVAHFIAKSWWKDRERKQNMKFLCGLEEGEAHVRHWCWMKHMHRSRRQLKRKTVD